MRANRLVVGLVQEKWHAKATEHQQALAECIIEAAAQLVCLQEQAFSPYFCTNLHANPDHYKEPLIGGRTEGFIGKIAKQAKVNISASLFEDTGYNTALVFNKEGQLIGFTRKQHIPSGEKYHEDHYFNAGNSDYPLHKINGHHAVGLPTCYDQWFPELSRIYGLKGGELLIYPTAIGSEPIAPNFDTQPLWEKVIVAQGIMANCFIIAVNRIGSEDANTLNVILNDYDEFAIETITLGDTISTILNRAHFNRHLLENAYKEQLENTLLSSLQKKAYLNESRALLDELTYLRKG